MCKKPAKPQIGYVYAVSRRDVPQPHLSVQVGHAVLAATLAYGQPKRTHPNLIVCTVENEEELNDLFNSLKEAGVPVVGWYEEDMAGALTAIATGTVHDGARKHFRKLPLLK